MLQTMAWSLKKKLILCGTFGVFLSIMGAVLIPIVDYVVKKMVEKVRMKLLNSILYLDIMATRETHITHCLNMLIL